MGIFSEWQPQYQERGIATFPVSIAGGDKRPSVRGYLKIGTKTSSQLSSRFADSDAFGLAVKKNRLTVLDVDTNDERVLIEAMDRHGQSPFIVRSGSGNYQAYYRHNGERRAVRPMRGVPIDILGDGYVVAPPSKGAKGRYEILQGSLDDLQNLPVMKGLPKSGEAPLHEIVQTPEGKRDETLWRHCMKQARHVDSLDELIDVARYFNETACVPPLPDAQVVAKAKSAWKHEENGTNRIGRTGTWLDTESDGALLLQDQDVFLLKTFLQLHQGRDARFIIANGLCDTLGWRRQRLTAARQRLVGLGIVKEVSAATGNRPAFYRWV